MVNPSMIVCMSRSNVYIDSLMNQSQLRRTDPHSIPRRDQR
jgi:hypothetical protein